mmetsp:Transcript_10528/g.17909  ORF Transcript_10528/g.17909 Transcript_10528/m.17909 type:complete len:144 (+) Transcript_10528:3-434(+)
MGADAFGTQRQACSTPGCGCTDFVSAFNAMTTDERDALDAKYCGLTCQRKSELLLWCRCGHVCWEHTDVRGGPALPALPAPRNEELERCGACGRARGACKRPGERGHLEAARAFCPGCFSRFDARRCRKPGEAGHWPSECFAA